MTPFLLYDENDEFISPFDLSHFDEVDEPPEVHILYPRPASSSSNLNLINFLLLVKLIHLVTYL